MSLGSLQGVLLGLEAAWHAVPPPSRSISRRFPFLGSLHVLLSSRCPDGPCHFLWNVPHFLSQWLPLSILQISALMPCSGETHSQRCLGGVPRHDEDLREPLVRRQGSQVSMRVARGSASWFSSHGRGLGPRDALKKDSRGLCRGAAGNPRFPRLLPGTLGNFPGCL